LQVPRSSISASGKSTHSEGGDSSSANESSSFSISKGVDTDVFGPGDIIDIENGLKVGSDGSNNNNSNRPSDSTTTMHETEFIDAYASKASSNHGNFNNSLSIKERGSHTSTIESPMLDTQERNSLRESIMNIRQSIQTMVNSIITSQVIN
jgi:hypothetical protein